MNYVEIQGGLGNQMFQYTFAKWLEKQTGSESVLQLGFYDYVAEAGGTVRNFELTQMSIRAVLYKGLFACRQVVEQTSDYDLSDSPTDQTFYRGYWLNKRFFSEVEKVIKKDLQLSDAFKTQRVNDYLIDLQKENTISVHLRRGDYLNQTNSKVFALLSEQYYINAVRKLKELIGTDDLKIYLFTDDYDYASSYMAEIDGISTMIIEPGSSCEDLYLMSQTQHHVIANSTYSWWGAALSEREGYTIYPSKWFVSKKTPDIFLDGWIEIQD